MSCLEREGEEIMGSVGSSGNVVNVQTIGAGGTISNDVKLNDTVTPELRQRIEEIANGDEPVGLFYTRTAELYNIYRELYDAVDNEEFKWTQSTENEMHRYYRYNNDGDVPGWATYQNGYRGFNGTFASPDLTPAGQLELERRVASAIAKEYKRYKKQRGEW